MANMSPRTCEVIINNSLALIGGTSSAASPLYPYAQMVEHLNSCILSLQNIMDDVDSSFMVMYVAFTSDGSISYTIGDAKLPIDTAKIRGYRRFVDVFSSLGGTYTRYNVQPRESDIRNALGFGWTDAKLCCMQKDGTTTLDSYELVFAVGAPANTATVTVRYSFYHILATTGNYTTLVVSMPDSFYPILEAMVALRALSKQAGSASESARIPFLQNQLAIQLQSIPNWRNVYMTSESRDRAMSQLVGGRQE